MFAVGMLLIVGTGFFVAAEFALVNLDRADINARIDRGERGLVSHEP
jgi:CBS domain containing-hemolysin-like protein